jgi:hydrogenase expression/formation protein HypE
MAEASGVGLEIDLKKIPVRQETIEICEFFGINPYELISRFYADGGSRWQSAGK